MHVYPGTMSVPTQPFPAARPIRGGITDERPATVRHRSMSVLATNNLPRVRDASPRIHDESRFVIVRDVALLDEHYRTVERDGRRVREYIDSDQLQVICDNTARRCDDGEYPLIVLGHLKYNRDDHYFDEADQPPRVGYVSNPRMGLDRRDRIVILADLHIDRGDYDKGVLDQNPRRSVEMFGKDGPAGYIDAVALLKRSPERDLGLVTYARDGATVEQYICRDCLDELGETNVGPMRPAGGSAMIEQEDLAMIVEAIVPGIVKGVMSEMRDYFDSMGEEEEPMPGEGEVPEDAYEDVPAEMGPGGDMDGDGVPNAEDAAPMDASMAAEAGGGGEEEEAEQYEAGAGIPSGTNTYVPTTSRRRPTAMSNERRPAVAASPESTTAFEADALRIENVDLRRQLKSVMGRVQALERENIRTNEQYESNRRLMVIQKTITEHHLNADAQQEFDEFAKSLPGPAFESYIKRMPAQYAKAPDAAPDVPVDRSHDSVRNPASRQDDTQELTQEEYKEVAQYARENNIDISSEQGPNRAVKGFLAKKAAQKNGTANGTHKPAFA